jgi:hypothetical protein
VSPEIAAQGGPPLPPPSGGRRGWRMVAAGAAILACGMAIGWAGTLYWFQNRVRQMRRDPGKVTAELTARIRSRLGLSADQTARVEAALTRRQETLTEIRGEFSPRIRAQFEGMRQDVAAVLTPEQAGIWARESETIIPLPRFLTEPKDVPPNGSVPNPR